MSNINFQFNATVFTHECESRVKSLLQDVERLKEDYHALLAVDVRTLDLSCKQIDAHPICKKLVELDEVTETLTGLLSDPHTAFMKLVA